MNRSRWIIATLAILTVQYAFADSIPFKINIATISIRPLTGNDDVMLTLKGPHANIVGFGGIGCFDWCDPNNDFFAPGSSPPLSIDQIGFSGLTNVTLGGHTFDPNSASFDGPVSAVVLGGFTFPAHPQSTFSACVPAAMPGPISGHAGSDSTNDFTNFALQIPSGGRFCTKWTFVPASGGFAGGFTFSSGRFVAATVPEPGTIGLLGLGLAGIGSLVRQRVRPRQTTA